jgi:hypothetical protein
MTLASFNRKLAPLGITCVNGRGYFYFACLDIHAFEGTLPESVYTPRFADLTEAVWLEIAGL